MRAQVRKRVEHGLRVMGRMEEPKPFDFMANAMRRIGRKIGHQESDNAL
jgi:hypothetical protein